MRISDEEKQAVHKAMLTKLGLLTEGSSEPMIDMDRIMIPENTQLHKVWVAVKGEVASLTADLEAMKEEKCRWQKEAKNLIGKLASAEANGAENARFAELYRLDLDDSADDMENENEYRREARQETWNEVDAKASKMSGTWRVLCDGQGVDE